MINPYLQAVDRVDELDWRQRAACRDHDPELWFPSTGQRRKRDEAKAICARCPVIEQCAGYAQAMGPLFGVWAGEAQDFVSANRGYRSLLAFSTGLKPCGTSAAYRRHIRHGEKPCESCCKAQTRARRTRGQARQ